MKPVRMPTRSEVAKLLVLGGVLLAVVLVVAVGAANRRAREAESELQATNTYVRELQGKLRTADGSVARLAGELRTLESEVDELRRDLAAAGPGKILVTPPPNPAEVPALLMPAEIATPSASAVEEKVGAQRAAEEAAAQRIAEEEAAKRAAEEEAAKARAERAKAASARALAAREARAAAARSSPCGEIAGQTAEDVGYVRRFCAQGIAEGMLRGAYASESMLVMKLASADMARIMRTRRLDTETLILNWMRGWRSVTGRRAVTVIVEWGDVEIAKGQTRMSGDQVTISR